MFKPVFCALLLSAAAVPLPGADTLIFTPDKADFLYSCGEKAEIRLKVVPEQGRPLKNCRLRLEVDGKNADQFRTVRFYDLDKGLEHSFSATLNKPGFLTMSVMLLEPGKRGQQLVRRCSLAFEPEKITPGVPAPADFADFWKKALSGFEQQAAPVSMRKMDSFSKAGRFTAYRLSLPAPDGNLYGFLCVPDKAGPHAALVTVAYAGPGFLKPELSDRFVILALNIHPYPPEKAPAAYAGQNRGKTRNARFSAQYMYLGMPDARSYYFFNGIVGTAHAVNWLAEQSFVNPERIGFYGQSQGGGFGLMLAALTNRFKAVSVFMPAFCDQNAAEAHRLSGWPCLDSCLPEAGDPAEIKAMARYYDAAYFAAEIRCPVRIAVGFQDFVCPPDSVYAAYNRIPGEKSILNLPRHGHAPGNVYSREIKALEQRLLK